MKRFIIISICLIAFVSCKKSDIDIVDREISIYAGETDFIRATSDYHLSYSTETKHFIFDCDESGAVKGNHVGEGIVKVSNDKTDDFVNVKVIPRHNLWNLPDVNFGCSVDDVTTLMGIPDEIGDDNDYSYYTYYRYGNADYITFVFDANYLLFSYDMVSTTAYPIKEFLNERYEYYGTSEEDILIYGDAESMNDATLFIACVQFDCENHVLYCKDNIFNKESFDSDTMKIAYHLK